MPQPEPKPPGPKQDEGYQGKPLPPEESLFYDRTPPLAPYKPLIQKTWFILVTVIVLLPLAMILLLRWTG